VSGPNQKEGAGDGIRQGSAEEKAVTLCVVEQLVLHFVDKLIVLALGKVTVPTLGDSLLPRTVLLHVHHTAAPHPHVITGGLKHLLLLVEVSHPLLIGEPVTLLEDTGLSSGRGQLELKGENIALHGRHPFG